MKKSTLVMTPWERRERLENAMASLMGNPNFDAFIDELREMQRNAMLDAIGDASVKDERITLACLGEIRTYEAIIGLYDHRVDQRLQKADAEHDR